MADICDIASEQMEFLASHHEAERRAKPDAEYYAGSCEDCEEEVEEPRRKLGYKCCAECAQLRESRNKLRSRLFAR